jgi:hypothetical protein
LSFVPQADSRFLVASFLGMTRLNFDFSIRNMIRIVIEWHSRYRRASPDWTAEGRRHMSLQLA